MKKTLFLFICVSIFIIGIVSSVFASPAPLQIDFRSRGTDTSNWEGSIYYWTTLPSNGTTTSTFNTTWGDKLHYFKIYYSSITGLATYVVDDNSDFTSPISTLTTEFEKNIGFKSIDFYARASKTTAPDDDTASITITKFNGTLSPSPSLFTNNNYISQNLYSGGILGSIHIEGNFQFHDVLSAQEQRKVGVQLSNSGAVPLPGAVLLLGAGMARLAAYARRRREQ